MSGDTHTIGCKHAGMACLLLLMALGTQAFARKNVIVVKAGDSESLLSAIAEANRQNEDPKSKRLYVLIPDGTYDLGDKTLTPITGHRIALVGQSMEGTIIINAPDIENEGISKTATLLNLGTDNYVQDLTLKNALDYYSSGAAGRAVCWQDKGQHTIFKRVRMLSYQDTFYTFNEDSHHYLEDSEIHGTVDFICGAGDVYFRNCLLVTEKRSPTGKGRNVIAAPRTSKTQWGFVFDHCTVRNDVSPFTYARGWHTTPRCVWLSTRLENPEKLQPSRFDSICLRSVDCLLKEYGTTDAEGRDITPRSNIITLVCKEDSNTVETIMSHEEAMAYSPKTVFPRWRPDLRVRKLQKKAKAAIKKNL